ncbi:MAG: hypothetical protein JO314_05320 [Acidobacteria bacterium]|nr:hypothetical protein [Acidobacteriota bacterium]
MKSLLLSCAIAALGVSLLSITATAQKKKPPVRQAPAKIIANCPNSGLTDAEVAEILTAHNKARASVKVPLLRWDCTLGKEAADWVATGEAGHSDTSFGENVFVSMTTDDSVKKAIDRWEDEHHNWTNKTGACATGKTCTHYTQMVWKSTGRIGCAINRNTTGKWKLMFVCNYDPSAQTGPAY